jgi:hypothetical protein
MLSRGMGVGSEFGDGNFWEVHGVWERFGLFVMIWLVWVFRLFAFGPLG